MVLTANDFISDNYFPEFDGRVDEVYINQAIRQAYFAGDGYVGLGEEKQDYAVALHAAFLLDNQFPVVPSLVGGQGTLKRYENFNDKIEFAINNIDPGNFKSNRYGQMLEDLLKGEYKGGFYV